MSSCPPSFIPKPFDAERLDAYHVARDLVSRVATITKSSRGFGDLNDQLRRAAVSVLLNISEGASQPRGSANKERHFAIARASVGEVAAALDAGNLLGLVSDVDTRDARNLAARIAAMLTGLIGQRRRAATASPTPADVRSLIFSLARSKRLPRAR